MNRAPSLLLFVVLAVGCSAQTPPARAPGRYVEKATIGGVERSWILRVPPQASEGKPLPLVIGLHGYAGTAAGFETYSGLGKAAEDRGWVSVIPDGLGRPQGWNAGFIDLSGRRPDDVAFLRELLDRIEKTTPIDRQRVYLVGHSNGAMMTYTAASALSDRIAAAGVMAGIIGITPQGIVKAPAQPVSLMIIHGTADRAVWYGEGDRALLNGIPTKTAFETWAGYLGIPGKPTVQTEGTLTRRILTGGKGGTEVQFISIQGGSHDWPGARAADTVNATRLFLDFFARQAKER